MRSGKFVIPIVCMMCAGPANSQDPSLESAVKIMVLLCVGGGHVDASNAGVGAEADLSLRSFDVKGKATLDYKVNRSTAQGLVHGIDSALTQVAADQADKVRACLGPVRAAVQEILFPARNLPGPREPTASTTHNRKPALQPAVVINATLISPSQSDSNPPHHGIAVTYLGSEPGRFAHPELETEVHRVANQHCMQHGGMPRLISVSPPEGQSTTVTFACPQ
jgi:hypothetical protein